jgi:hypothetical protein
MAHARILWRRLDGPGHDACRLIELPDCWRLAGTAVLELGGEPARLDYAVECDRAWVARAGRVTGWIGAREVDHRIARGADAWTLDGTDVPSVRACVDLDYGFTPATNAIPLRRLALAGRQAADAPAAWLDVAAGTLSVLHQRYERKSEHVWFYAAPTVPYAAPLSIDAQGFTRLYPGLWEAVS